MMTQMKTCNFCGREKKGSHQFWCELNPDKESQDQEKKRRSERMKGEKNTFFNQHHTIETKKLLSEIKKKHLSIKENNPMFGKHHTEETKKLMSKNKKKLFHSEEFRISHGRKRSKNKHLKTDF